MELLTGEEALSVLLDYIKKAMRDPGYNPGQVAGYYAEGKIPGHFTAFRFHKYMESELFQDEGMAIEYAKGEYAGGFQISIDGKRYVLTPDQQGSVGHAYLPVLDEITEKIYIKEVK